jgi:hypothetical protein
LNPNLIAFLFSFLVTAGNQKGNNRRQGRQHKRDVTHIFSFLFFSFDSPPSHSPFFSLSVIFSLKKFPEWSDLMIENGEKDLSSVGNMEVHGEEAEQEEGHDVNVCAVRVYVRAEKK